jgi:predicted nucleotidyltransferase
VDDASHASDLPHRIGAALAGCEGVRVALLFGSHARGQARPGSDVDVAIVGAWTDVSALAALLSDRLGTEVDVVRLDDEAGVPLLEAVLRDGIVVYEANRGDAAMWRSRVLAQMETDRPWYRRMRDAWLRRVATEGL